MGGWSWLPGADDSLNCSVPLMDGSGLFIGPGNGMSDSTCGQNQFWSQIEAGMK